MSGATEPAADRGRPGPAAAATPGGPAAADGPQGAHSAHAAPGAHGTHGGNGTGSAHGTYSGSGTGSAPGTHSTHGGYGGGGTSGAGAAGTEPLLVADQVALSFGPTAALAGASMTVAPGEVVAVLGPSGSGKSTLLHCLAGILVPQGGEVRYRGRRLDTLPEAVRSRLRRDDFGFVFQFGQLVPELPVVENVALPLRLGGQRRRAAEQAARAWLDRLDVGDLASRRPGELSGGQQQRVAVARALVTGPRVVFADEPTGALDSLNGERVLDLLVGSAREQGASVVLVTHEARVAAYADREVVVRDGRVATPARTGA